MTNPTKKRAREAQTDEAEETDILLHKIIRGQEKKEKKVIDEEHSKNESTAKKKKKKMEEEHEEKEDDDDEKTQKEYRKKIQFRSTWPAFHIFKDVLDAEALEELRSGPLKSLFAAFYDERIDRNHFSKSNKLVEMLADMYDPKTDAFIIGGKKYIISSTDTASILGIQKEGKGDVSEDVDVESMNKLLQSGRVMKKSILKALEKLQREGVENDEDRRKKKTNLVRLVVLEMCISFLFPNAGGFVSNSLVSSIWGDVKHIPWAKNVNKFLSTCLKARLQSKGTAKNTGGCVHLILYWLCEKTSAIKPINGRENAEPKMMKWDLRQLTKIVDSKKKLVSLFSGLKSDTAKTNSESEGEEVGEKEGKQNNAEISEEENWKEEIRKLKKELEEVKHDLTNERKRRQEIEETHKVEETAVTKVLEEARQELEKEQELRRKLEEEIQKLKEINKGEQKWMKIKREQSCLLN